MAGGNGRTNGHPGLQIPGEMKIGFRHHNVPISHPVSVVHPVSGGVMVHAFGGMTPLEHAACMIAGQFAHGTPAKEIVDRAAEILLACQDYSGPGDGEQDEQEQEPGEAEQPSPILTA